MANASVTIVDGRAVVSLSGPENINALVAAASSSAAEAEAARDAAVAAAAAFTATPFQYGATGTSATADTAALSAMFAAGIKSIFIPKDILINSITIPANTCIIIGEGASIKRNPADTSNQWINVNSRGVKILGGTLDGQSPLTSNAHNILTFGAGSSEFVVTSDIKNPKAVGGAWGAAWTAVSTNDFVNGTWSRVSSRLSCDPAQEGTFGFQVIKSWQIDISGSATHFFNGAGVVDNADLPVSVVLTQGLLNIHDFEDADCGGGVTIYRTRSGVSGGVDVLGHNYVSGLINCSNLISVRPRTYGFVAQGSGINAVNVTVEDGGTPGDLMGGILWQAKGGSLVNPVVRGASGIAIDAGLSESSTITNPTITGSTPIAINFGASFGFRCFGGYINGPTTPFLGSAWDGANEENWGPFFGRDAVIDGADITVIGASGVAVRVVNGFREVSLRNITAHIKNAGALGKSFDLAGANPYRSVGCFEVLETDSDPNNWTRQPSVASATATVIPSHADLVEVTGTTQIDFLRTAAQADAIGKVTGGIATSQGSGYTDAVTATISGDGTGATCIPVKSEGKILGVYITNGGSGYSTATVSFSDPGGGSGASVVLSVGPFNAAQRQVVLAFINATPIGNFAGNIFLPAAFTASAFNISRLPLLFNSTSVTEIGR